MRILSASVMRSVKTRRSLYQFATAFISITMAGCSAMSPVQPSAAVQGLQGKVHGGQQPISGARISLFSIGTTGYGSGATLVAQTTTDANGNFTIPTPFTCPANSGLMVLSANGGDAGAGTNNAIGEAAIVGQCSSLTTSSYFFISEETTVAAAYALAQFLTVSGGQIDGGTSTGNLQGLKNAAGTAGNLVSTLTGQATPATANPGMVLPTATVNTLADILASCVNSGTAGVASTTCSALFTAATPPGGSAPTDTFAAVIDIAQNPGNNAAALYALATPSAPYQPTLTSAPGDFALAIQYNGGQIANAAATSGLAIDAVGNAWVANGAGASPKSISEISPSGVFLSGTNGYTNGIAGGNGLSIDASGKVWVAVAALNEILGLNSSGAVVSMFTPSSLVKPTGIALNNRDGSVWTADTNNQPSLNNGNGDFTGTTVSNVTSAGADAAGSPYGGMNGPFGVEIDGLGNVWVANTASNTTTSNIGSITKLAPPAVAGNSYTALNIPTGLGSYPSDVAFDSANNVWVAEESSVGEYSNAGALISTSNYVSLTTNIPSSILIDGLGRAFVSNATNGSFSAPGSLTVFSSTGTLLSTANGGEGYLAGNTIPSEPFTPTGLGIDLSGNVWISGVNLLASPSYQFVTEIVGIAAPVVTPTTVASSTNKYGQRP